MLAAQQEGVRLTLGVFVVRVCVCVCVVYVLPTHEVSTVAHIVANDEDRVRPPACVCVTCLVALSPVVGVAVSKTVGSVALASSNLVATPCVCAASLV